MKNQRPSIDGFVPRRQGGQLGELHTQSKQVSVGKIAERPSLQSEDDMIRGTVGAQRPNKSLGRSDIDDSLRDIDDSDTSKPLSRRQRRKLEKQGKPRNKVKRIVKWFFILLLIAAIGIGGYLGFKFLIASQSILQGSFFDIVQNQPLKTDANGRSNFVIFGTAEDDEGGNHGGANLTDSIMLLSVDQTNKNAYMISLPRDLWVEYADTCWVGNQGKLNAAYSCASDDGVDEAAGAAALQDQVKTILGVDVQYYIHLNFTAVVDAVDAVGGVDVTIESEDPRGILDRNFDWKCNFKCYYVNYDNGEVAHLDGEHALALARARNAAGGYGLPGGNFDREKNQQKIIKALREKALSAGTLTNLGAVTGLIDALGSNLRTNVETKELRTLMSLASDISSTDIISLTLVNEDTPLVTTGSYNGQSIVRSVAGISDYSDIQAYIKKSLTSDPVAREDAKIVVLNGSGTVGIGQAEADTLEDAGFTISVVDNAPEGTYAPIEIYKIGDGNTATAAKLASRYNVTIKMTAPPVLGSAEADFVIVVGPAKE
jgi:LCP family protein required for cell wall assembly